MKLIHNIPEHTRGDTWKGLSFRSHRTRKHNFEATAPPDGSASFAAGYWYGSTWQWGQRIWRCYGDGQWDEVSRVGHTHTPSVILGGSAGQVLTSDGTGGEWGDIPDNIPIKTGVGHPGYNADSAFGSSWPIGTIVFDPSVSPYLFIKLANSGAHTWAAFTTYAFNFAGPP